LKVSAEYLIDDYERYSQTNGFKKIYHDAQDLQITPSD
jgi:hypothetical protein